MNLTIDKNLSIFKEAFSALVGEWFLQKWAIFYNGKIYTSLNISIDGLQSTCIYQLKVTRGLCNFCLGLTLVELGKNTRWTWTTNTHLYCLAKLTKHFRQVQQVQALNINYEDLCWLLIDAYKLAVTRQYLYLVKYKFSRSKKLSHF